ncbi:MAG: hypothetical protein GY705_12480 [Bacteroidetes bacterium]|nr:hypothetical protein [Bacteroidota bacterium]
MSIKYIEVDLDNEQKQAILKYASFFVGDKITKNDLLNKRKKWIRFKPTAISDVIGELSYYFNRCKSNDLFHFLDELICHLEYYE